MWPVGLNLLLYLEFIPFASGVKGHFYRHTFYWEYEMDGLTINDRSPRPDSKPQAIRFDPARSRLAVLMRGYYEDARIRSKELNNIRFVIEETYQYEVGYIMHEMYEKYKKLVEQFNKGERNRSLDYLRLYKNKNPHVPRERLIYGNDKIERTEVAQKLYFEIYHLSNMIHEVTRKWGVSSTDTDPTFGGRPDTKHEYFNNDADYQKNRIEMQKKREKHMRQLYKERDKVLNQMLNEKEASKKMKNSKSNEMYGVDKDGNDTNNWYIKNRYKEQGWQQWHEKRINGSVVYRPGSFHHDYGWDIPERK